MDGIQGPSRITTSPNVRERAAGGGKQDPRAFQQALDQQPDPQPDQHSEAGRPQESASEAALRRALQRRARIGRNNDGEGRHVDVVA